MSLITKLFGKNASEKPPTIQEAIQKLLDTEDLLRKRSDLLEKKIEDQTNIAKQNAATNKRAALKALKIKRLYEKRLNELDGTLTTLEYQRESLENSTSNANILKTMGFAAKAFKTVNSEFDIGKVEELKDELADQQELANEIGNAISKPTNSMNEFDEDELMKELEELEEQDIDYKLSGIPNAIDTELPDKIKKKTKSSENELNKLTDWAT